MSINETTVQRVQDVVAWWCVCAQVFGALRQRLEKIIQTRNSLAARLVEVKGSKVHPHAKQQQINREVDALVLQIRGANQVRAGVMLYVLTACTCVIVL